LAFTSSGDVTFSWAGQAFAGRSPSGYGFYTYYVVAPTNNIQAEFGLFIATIFGCSVLARKIMQMRFLMTSGSRGRANNVRLLMAGFLLGACGSGTSVAPTAQHGMVLGSSAQLVSDASGRTTLAATLQVRNVSDTTARVFHGEAPCIPALVITAYSTGSTTRVWNATEAYRNVYCYAIRYTVAIPPGQTWEYRISTPVVDILGDSLPAGAYRFTGSAKWLEPGFPVDLELGVFALKR
jgi:hypothetical protein